MTLPRHDHGERPPLLPSPGSKLADTLQVICTSGQAGIHTRVIAETTGRTQQIISGDISMLSERGLVEKVGWGVWRAKFAAIARGRSVKHKERGPDIADLTIAKALPESIEYEGPITQGIGLCACCKRRFRIEVASWRHCNLCRHRLPPIMGEPQRAIGRPRHE